MKRGPPSLFDICILASASGDLWQVQTRRMAALPEDAANRLLAMLLCCGRLCEPSALQVFRHAASELSIPQSVPLSPQWMSYVAGLRYGPCCVCSSQAPPTFLPLMKRPLSTNIHCHINGRHYAIRCPCIQLVP
jgi:hypothetical protein